MWQTFGPWLAGGGLLGIVGLLSRLAYRLHSDAVLAYKEQAAAWERIAAMHERRADLREAQLGQVLGRASEKV